MSSIRRFAPDFERPSPDKLREWYVGRLFESNGSPLYEAAGIIVQEFLESPHATISAMILHRRTKLNPFLIQIFCRQMCAVDILEEATPLSNCFSLAKGQNASHLIQKIRERCAELADENGNKSIF